MDLKPFLKAWARGTGICVYLFCISLAVTLLGFIGELLPPVLGIPFWIAFGPPVIYWVSRWLAPDLFGAPRDGRGAVTNRDNR